MGDRLRAGILSGYVTSQLGQLSLASLRGRLIEYQLWGKGGNVTSVGWQVTLCDPMWVPVALWQPYELLYICYLLTTLPTNTWVCPQTPPRSVHPLLQCTVMNTETNPTPSAAIARIYPMRPKMYFFWQFQSNIAINFFCKVLRM